jgi:hypothetical protein
MARALPWATRLAAPTCRKLGAFDRLGSQADSLALRSVRRDKASTEEWHYTPEGDAKGDETFLAGPDRKSIGSECLDQEPARTMNRDFADKNRDIPLALPGNPPMQEVALVGGGSTAEMRIRGRTATQIL